jgi:hypothetical protein
MADEPGHLLLAHEICHAAVHIIKAINPLSRNVGYSCEYILELLKFRIMHNVIGFGQYIDGALQPWMSSVYQFAIHIDIPPHFA